MTRSNAVAATAVLAALTSFNAWAADSLPVETHKVLTAALAVEAAQAAIAACKAQGYNVTVTVADRAGLPKVVIVRDGPPGLVRVDRAPPVRGLGLFRHARLSGLRGVRERLRRLEQPPTSSIRPGMPRQWGIVAGRTCCVATKQWPGAWSNSTGGV